MQSQRPNSGWQVPYSEHLSGQALHPDWLYRLCDMYPKLITGFSVYGTLARLGQWTSSQAFTGPVTPGQVRAHGQSGQNPKIGVDWVVSGDYDP
eukprot:1195393-Prorocentrum_minimum.AAC.3